jgi:hypothetical protein
MTTINLEISYAQLAVFQADLAQPFNNWTDAHVAQGFSWRPGSVSFRTLDETGEIHVEAFQSMADYKASSSAARIISVPFLVSNCEKIEIASVTDYKTITMEAGEYELIFEHGRGVHNEMAARLIFSRTHGAVKPRIIRADSDLRPGASLVMLAEPA